MSFLNYFYILFVQLKCICIFALSLIKIPKMKNYFKILVLLIIAFLCQYKACAQSNFSSNPKEVILIDGKTTDSVVIYNNFKIGDKSLIRFVDCTVVVKGNLIAEGLPKMIFVNSKMLVYGRLNVKSKNIQKVRIVKRKIK